MARRRFRRLERAGGAEPAPDAQPDGAPDVAPAIAPAVAGRARSLEREGALVLDASPPDTDFCRYCRFENRAGTQRCLNCGTVLGGPDQEAFDEDVRARRAAQRGARDAEAQQAPVAAPRASTPQAPGAAPAIDVEALLRAAERDEPGFGTVIASGVLAACIFALVSIPLRRLFGGAGGAAGGAFELVLLVAITAGLYAGVRRKLHKL